jgi:hypothetical protein
MDATTPRTTFEPVARGIPSTSLARPSGADWADSHGLSQLPVAQRYAIASVPVDSVPLGIAVESTGQQAIVRSQGVADTSAAGLRSLAPDRPLFGDDTAVEDGTSQSPAPAVEARSTEWQAVDSLPYFVIAFAAPLGWLVTHNIRRGNREEPISVRPAYLGHDDGEQG